MSRPEPFDDPAWVFAEVRSVPRNPLWDGGGLHPAVSERQRQRSEIVSIVSRANFPRCVNASRDGVCHRDCHTLEH